MSFVQASRRADRANLARPGEKNQGAAGRGQPEMGRSQQVDCGQAEGAGARPSPTGTIPARSQRAARLDREDRQDFGHAEASLR